MTLDVLLDTDFGKKFCLVCGEPLYGDQLSHVYRVMICGCRVGDHNETLLDTINYHFTGPLGQGDAGLG